MFIAIVLHFTQAPAAGTSCGVARLFALFPELRDGKENKQIIHRCSITPLTVIFLFCWSFKHKRLWAQKDVVSGCCSAGLEKPGWMNHMHVSFREGGVWFQFWEWFFAGFPHFRQIAPSEAASENREDCSPPQVSPLNYNHSFLTNSNVSINKDLSKPHGWGRQQRYENGEVGGRWKEWPAASGGGSRQCVHWGCLQGRVAQTSTGHRHLPGTNTQATWTRHTNFNVCLKVQFASSLYQNHLRGAVEKCQF